ncbi:ArsR/SmtB family transcription factor [Kitasatospora sp. NPDC101183]|uniref:ArsR/SmtB family transcription factor n=1 Tax=Kitasatospora sp. NPDC101183 TaxID=3364100 RepID=UPI00380D2AFD
MVEDEREPVGGADGAPGAPGVAGQPEGWVDQRDVTDVAVLKALADPLRLAILDALRRADGGPLTVKELAAALGEPQTKLYRHIKQLEKAGLILVAGTRLVSGIVESRYSLAQRSIRLASDVFSEDSPARGDAYDAMLAGMDRVRDEFRARIAEGRLDFSRPRDGSEGTPALFADVPLRLSPERLIRLRNQLGDIFDELNREGPSEAEDAVEVTAFALLYGLRPGTDS